MSLDPELRSRILASVDQGFTDQIEFTKTMMRFPSLRGAEHAVRDFVFQTLRSRGYALDRFEMDEAALQRHVGAGAISEQHSRAPIVVGIHRPRSETGCQQEYRRARGGPGAEFANHSRDRANSFILRERDEIWLVACIEGISAGDEITYDYGRDYYPDD